MTTEAPMQEYLEEIRREVCSHCVERPADGPPCLPLGKRCGVELHLPQLVRAIREVHSGLIGPYLDHDREEVCATCSFLHSEYCPCPMDRLALMVVEAVEAADRRHADREWVRLFLADLPAKRSPDMEAITAAFQEAAGTWKGCDWPTTFGLSGLNLDGLTAAESDARGAAAEDALAVDWRAAAAWLRLMEQRAAMAEEAATQAVAAAGSGAWREAREHARQAWALEFHSGRTLRSGTPTWQKLYQAIEAAAAGHGAVELQVLS